MNYAITFSGPAGSGANTSWILLAEILAKKWYNIIVDKEYQSIIKGGNNNLTVYISDTDHTLTRKIDLFVAFDKFASEKNTPIFDIKKIEDITTIKMPQKNIFAFGIGAKIFGITEKEAEQHLRNTFKKHYTPEHTQALKEGYQHEIATIHDCSKKIGNEKKLYFGNEIIAKGAINSGLGFYSFYPMTPASTIATVINKDPKTIDSALAKNLETTDDKIVSFQAGDEIAVSMAMLGANFAGKRAMCGTSGWGFALMSESIAMAHQTEIGSVYILSQRDGPSTWTPTYTAQSDINFALNPTFGDTKPIVIYPTTYENGYNLIGKCLNRAKKYQHPIIVLLDKQYSESYVALEENTLQAEPIDNGPKIENPDEDFARYKITEDGISPYTIPWTENGEFCGTSYEHNEYGESIEDPENKKKMTEKKFQKLMTFQNEVFNKDFFWYEIINPEAKKFIITTGFNYYPCKNFVDKNPEIGLISIHSLFPFDLRLKEFLHQNKDTIEELIFVELNYSGQLQDLVMKACELYDSEFKPKIKHFRKNELYPLFEEDLEKIF